MESQSGHADASSGRRSARPSAPRPAAALGGTIEPSRSKTPLGFAAAPLPLRIEQPVVAREPAAIETSAVPLPLARQSPAIRWVLKPLLLAALFFLGVAVAPLVRSWLQATYESGQMLHGAAASEAASAARSATVALAPVTAPAPFPAPAPGASDIAPIAAAVESRHDAPGAGLVDGVSWPATGQAPQAMSSPLAMPTEGNAVAAAVDGAAEHASAYLVQFGAYHSEANARRDCLGYADFAEVAVSGDGAGKWFFCRTVEPRQRPAAAALASAIRHANPRAAAILVAAGR